MRKFTILNIATSEKPETASNTSWSGSTTESDYIQPWVISRPQCSNGVDSKTLLHQSTSAQTQTGLNLWSHFRGAVDLLLERHARETVVRRIAKDDEDRNFALNPLGS